MIRYFPEPYPDESIQSICIRYARRYGYDSYTDVLRGMYGKDYATRRINPLFGLYLSSESETKMPSKLDPRSIT